MFYFQDVNNLHIKLFNFSVEKNITLASTVIQRKLNPKIVNSMVFRFILCIYNEFSSHITKSAGRLSMHILSQEVGLEPVDRQVLRKYVASTFCDADKFASSQSAGANLARLSIILLLFVDS